MRTDTPTRIRLADYQRFPFAIDRVALDFALSPGRTLVRASMQVRRTGAADAALELDGEELELIAISVDGRPLGEGEYTLDAHGLEIPGLPDAFTLQTEVAIAPAANTALSGLYMSGGRFCSQCEAEGFRRITYWPDRPDVMSCFSVRMSADRAQYPILLSNGSPGETGDDGAARHFATWDDPHPKPSYLFALCAGDYDVMTDQFTTMNGRTVTLGIHVDKGDGARAAYAMDALKRSMRWDEEVFGREYDLDVFNIVAVRDFNFGAMENKGLNIFNSAYVLADAETATDADFEAIESIVAHEYFHNWTGNRITCRDWFQLCLKEGLTVFRDQEFSADMRDPAVQRIKDVLRLRARQFAEDAGPLAHPVRPTELGSIDNLYTATVYEKGSELIRMLRAFIGADAFARGMTLYFDRHDGQAVTIEDFYACFAEASGQNLEDFLVWYARPGTPLVEARIETGPDGATLHVSQSLPGMDHPLASLPLPIPLDVCVFDADTGESYGGADLLGGKKPVLTDSAARFALSLPAAVTRPLLSFNRGFAAPVRTDVPMTREERLRLVEIETDAFNQWDGVQSLLRGAILERADHGDATVPDDGFISSVYTAINRRSGQPALAALMLRVPTVNELFMERDPADPAALAAARRSVRAALAQAFAGDARDILATPEPTPFRPDADQAGIRALRGAAMAVLSMTREPADIARLAALFDGAVSMTESLAALTALIETATPEANAALDAFAARWANAPIVMDKWFSVQAMTSAADAVERARALTRHPAFDLRNPNRVRSVLASLAMSNLPAFHRPDGEGHRLVAEMVREIDPLNPALSARLLTAFEQWKRLEPVARASAEATLKQLAEASLSRNAADIVQRALG